MFDGTPASSTRIPEGGEQGWGTNNFDLGKTGVQSFLISNAIFWFDVYHVDGLRVDAVASMLYLDYAGDRGSGTLTLGVERRTWKHRLLRKLNEEVFARFRGR